MKPPRAHPLQIKCCPFVSSQELSGQPKSSRMNNCLYEFATWSTTRSRRPSLRGTQLLPQPYASIRQGLYPSLPSSTHPHLSPLQNGGKNTASGDRRHMDTNARAATEAGGNISGEKLEPTPSCVENSAGGKKLKGSRVDDEGGFLEKQEMKVETFDNASNKSREGEASITRMVAMAVPGAVVSSPHQQNQQRKLKSYSQPLPRSEIPRSRSNLKKKHSLDEDRTASSLDHPGSVSLQSPASSLAVGSIPEFIGSGGGTGIFRPPARAAVHPGRPPPVELRPRPLRETQAGTFLRAIACTTSQLWSAEECGVRFWHSSEVFEGWEGSGKARSGDEDSAPSRWSTRTPAALCLVVDAGGTRGVATGTGR
ncbi:hypothetical protein HPP92_019772 [Vanilla planifolia]|uniref:IP5PC-F beta-propeller domain-containing protein n=1 Tax=Vanilla planifolia TaxID=51239 RepID=A0A835UL93_VANPL|nr:hypothetical protein HPP92_019772 [Vanilla planifolia]